MALISEAAEAPHITLPSIQTAPKGEPLIVRSVRTPMIVLKSIKVSFPSKSGKDTHALRGIDLTIGTGEFFGIIGRSGAGKSTLIRTLNLLERPHTGEVWVNQLELTALKPAALRRARQQIGMIFQQFNLLHSRTVFENVALPLELSNLPKPQIRVQVLALLDMVGLADKQHEYPYQLSGGQKQRVAIARALALKPKVLLCDEATSALDPKTTQSILQLLRQIAHNLGITVVMITHEMDIVKMACDRVAVLHQGEIVEEQNVLDLFTRPQSEVAKDFIRASTRMELPSALRRRLNSRALPESNPVWRISFTGQAAHEPLIAYVIQQFDLTINIIQAHLESVQETTIGIMIVEMLGAVSNIQRAMEFLEGKDIHIEVLGHVIRAI